ncbi:MAG: HNH endonuclease [Eggerthellaceae bacterium]|nr:HNH endonuclease [Eggerthellaceae bacterium]
MPSSNPRYANYKAREGVRAKIRRRVLAGEPCALCGKPIDLSAPQTFIDPKDGKRKRSPWSLEVDEIVPISLGGSPIDERNCQPAHRICNQRKGNGQNQRGAAMSIKGKNSKRW